MGLKEKSSVVSILIGVLLAAVAIAQITYVILSGNENIRIFLVGSAMGIFVVLGLTVLRVVQNDNDVEDLHKERATAKAKECPDYWARQWRCGGKDLPVQAAVFAPRRDRDEDVAGERVHAR